MDKKTVSGLLLTLLLLGMLTLAFNIRLAGSDWTWTETIYIRADGSVEPDIAPISSVDNVTYTLTDNVVGDVPTPQSAVVVERDNIILDGAGYTLQGTPDVAYIGLALTDRSNITIKNMKIQSFWTGIRVSESANNTISGNSITDNYNGIRVSESANNIISGNNITANWWYGLSLSSSADNVISGNTVTHNRYGIEPDYSANNSISGNAITHNRYGINLIYAANNSISDNSITNNDRDGIFLRASRNNTISGNSITASNRSGIYLEYFANYNNISGNTVTHNEKGIHLHGSANNTILGSTITHNDFGIYLEYFAHDNIIYHNNFVNNSDQVYTENSMSVWDDGHPSGGNYWSDYTGEDADGDGIGDTPYVIDEDNQDRYPLMSPWSPKAPAEVPFWMQWWFWAMVIAGIAVSVGAVYFLIKRKPPTPTAPPLPSEGADTPAQKI